MLKPLQEQDLPTGWTIRRQVEESYKWFQGETTVLPHFLNEGKIEANIRTNAGLRQPFTPDVKPSGDCITIQCSTGSYYAVYVPLIWEWLAMIGKSAYQLEGLEIKVLEACGQQVTQCGASQSYLVKLQVEGKTVSIHFYNTNHKVMLQGGKTMRTFYDKVFAPYLEGMSRERALKIVDINNMMSLEKRGTKRTMNQTTRTQFTPQQKKKTPMSESGTESIPEGDQQLSDSILLLSTIHPPALLAGLGASRLEDEEITLGEIPASGMEDEQATPLSIEVLPATGRDGEQTTSTPNPTPVSSPSKPSAPPPPAPPLPVPMCPEAAEYMERAPVSPSHSS